MKWQKISHDPYHTETHNALAPPPPYIQQAEKIVQYKE
jgi:hypothetical protein